MTDGQRLALDQVEGVVRASEGKLELLTVIRPDPERPGLELAVTVGCRGYPRIEGGLELRDRERLLIVVGPEFPFAVPTVHSAHTRFSGHPHVQWGSQLCLYLSSDTEWDPADGMFGFLTRLDEWLHQGAANELDPVGGPLHPPVAYPRSGQLVIARADTPAVPAGGWHGLAQLRKVSAHRADITGWKPWDDREVEGQVAAAILLEKPVSFFEYPRRLSTLLRVLSDQDASFWRVVIRAARAQGSNVPLLFVLGSPMRGAAGGERRQHLTAWYIDQTVIAELLTYLDADDTKDEEGIAGEGSLKRLAEWATSAEVKWCSVQEARPEVTQRRDSTTPMSWFFGKTVAIWGCGAIGGHVAEFAVRAGARKVVLVDNRAVSAGVLVRQPFEDADIDQNKAAALASRLGRIFPGACVVEAISASVSGGFLAEPRWHEGIDLVLDCTASRAVLKKLELECGKLEALPVPIASLVVGPNADHGLVALAHRGSVGGPGSVLRSLKLGLLRSGPMELLDEFWPGTESRARTLFQPEPGCSDVTFVGAATDVSALAAAMLHVTAKHLRFGRQEGGVAGAISQPGRALFGEKAVHEVATANPVAVRDLTGGYQVQLSPAAWSAMRNEIATSARKRGRDVETGGVLYGTRDDAARVIWIDEASPPPVDSSASAYGFVCGVMGVEERVKQLAVETAGTTRFVGMWHTHPDMVPAPSAEDYRGMEKLTGQLNRASDRWLMLIVGGDLDRNPDTRAYTFGRGDIKAGTPQGRLRVRAMYPIRMGVYTAVRGARAHASWVSETLQSLLDRLLGNGPRSRATMARKS